MSDKRLLCLFFCFPAWPKLKPPVFHLLPALSATHSDIPPRFKANAVLHLCKVLSVCPIIE